MEERYYRIGEAAALVGSTVATLRDWHRRGKLIPDHITPGGHRFYTERQLREFLGKPLPLPGQRKTYLYARVSSRAQRPDLEHQVAALQQFATAAGMAYDEILTDIGSGMNYRRKNLIRLVEHALNGEVDRIVVAHKDRLARFGYDFIEQVFIHCGATIVLVNRTNDPDFMHELADDLIALVQHFCARYYGKRSHQYKRAMQQVSETLHDVCDPQ